jgi:undecaprenyl diphosphate synthase
MEKKDLKVPKHVGILMDGNRRWAKERNLPWQEGHKKGFAIMKIMPEWFFSSGVEIVTVYAFSAEHWSKSRDEVNGLMKIIQKSLFESLEYFVEKGYRVLVSGRMEELPGDLPEICSELIIKTKDGKKGILNICLNYDGRTEIVDAIRKMFRNNIEIEQVHEGMLRKYFYQGELCDPEMIIRTAGTQKLSGFLLWQASDSELYFMTKYWPDFEKIDVEKILKEYSDRVNILI